MADHSKSERKRPFEIWTHMEFEPQLYYAVLNFVSLFRIKSYFFSNYVLSISNLFLGHFELRGRLSWGRDSRSRRVDDWTSLDP